MQSSADDRPALVVIAEYAASLRVEDLPEAVRNKALTCLIDTIWGCLRVHDDLRALAALRSTLLDGVGMQSAILTTGHRADAADAAFVNAIACASTDRSDTHVATATHPGIIVIPALLAALSRSGGSGADLLRGIVVGYEVMSRIARAIMSPELASVFRPTAIAAPVAAAVAVATGLRLDFERDRRRGRARGTDGDRVQRMGACRHRRARLPRGIRSPQCRHLRLCCRTGCASGTLCPGWRIWASCRISRAPSRARTYTRAR